MDAFAVSICKGMSVCKLKPKYVALASGWFGGFQALMPLLGYYLGVSFASFVTNVDHWIAFVLLAIIGGKMIKEASHKEEDCCVVPDFSFKTMLAMAIATSIDALLVGVGFALTNNEHVFYYSTIIGVVTFIISLFGCFLGSVLGVHCMSKSARIGGIVLIAIAIKQLF